MTKVVMIRQAMRYILVVLVLAFLFELLTLNYSAIEAVLIGAVISWPLVLLFRFLVANRRRVFLPIFFILSLGACFLYARLLLPLYLAANPSPPLINEYRLTISNPDWQSGIFSIREAVSINPQWTDFNHEPDLPATVDLPGREVTSTRIGLFTWQVRIMPDEADPSGEAEITLPDGHILKGTICTYTCEKIDVELNDAPKGSFLAARNAENIHRYPYIDTETISWSVINLDQGITFAFVPPPFNFVRPIIDPLLGVAALDQWLLGILGTVCTLVVTPVVKPLIQEAARKRFGPWLEKRPGAKKAQEVKASEKKPKQ